MDDSNNKRGSKGEAALVFGASGEQGRAVVEGLVDAGYYPVFAFGRYLQTETATAQYLEDALGATIYTGDIENPDTVTKALRETKASAIMLITTTDLPYELGQTSGFSDAAEAEFQVISNFFVLLKEVYKEDHMPRHVVFSCRENVQRVNREYFEKTGKMWVEPLDDGSIVPHYSAKGRGGEFALSYLQDTPDLKLTLITLPFLYSNFLGFFCPLPDESKTQWVLSACFGEGAKPIDMMGARDLSVIVPNILAEPSKYHGQNLRLVGERVSMDQVAGYFEDLFGKPVIYNPLTPSEVAKMEFAAAPAMAQMCQFIGNPGPLAHEGIQLTGDMMGGKAPQTFQDWLLTHSESSVFQECGLTLDAPDIEIVTVFGATSPEGYSVIRGLLADTRKKYTIRAVVSKKEEEERLRSLGAEHIQLVKVDLDDTASCLDAVNGVDGVFLVTHFLQDDHAQDLETEERHIRNVIDACEAAHSVRHLVFSTLESADVMSHHMTEKNKHLVEGNSNAFDARARAAAYARTKKLSVTYVLLPYYTENFLEVLKRYFETNGGTDQGIIGEIPQEKFDAKVVCMSIDDLGPAVANIFDSYQVYAGHEIGLVTDFASYADVKEMMESVSSQAESTSLKNENDDGNGGTKRSKHSFMRDFGQMFGTLAHSDAVRMRRSVARTMQLVPSARPLREWIELNRNNAAFREKLGLR